VGKGFGVKREQFCLRVQTDQVTYPIYFWVIQDGKVPIVQRAKFTAIALFAIVQHGEEADGFSAICEEFGEEYVQQLL